MIKSKIFERPINKKGQGISINVIIIAAIALLVLVILAVLIGGSGRDLAKGTKCITAGGVCQLNANNCDADKLIEGTDLCPVGKECCSPMSVRDTTN
ncbi:MAG: hypothetical protein ABIB43_05415 [archaeon]